MLKQLFSFLMILICLSTQVSASSSVGLKQAFDELNYSLTVEWDQKDKEFKTIQMTKFKATVEELKKQGLTDAQLIEFTKSQIKNAQAAKDFETAFNMININRMSASEATKYIVETMEKSYQTGASWEGNAWVSIGWIALVVVATVIFVNSSSAGDSVSAGGGGEYTCSDVQMCDRYCEPAWEGSYIESCWYDCYYVCI